MIDIRQNIFIILLTIIIVFLISRVITLMTLRFKILPESILSNNKRPHHFVYGNILIVLTSFITIILNIKISIIIVILYSIGIGLILDEFPHWVGNVKELTRNVVFIKGSIKAIIISILVLLTLFLIT